MKKKIYDYDVYMAKIREAEETSEEKRTPEQKKLLLALENSPSWNDLFRKESSNDKESE